MDILVLGGAGYIGSRLVGYLEHNGHTIHSYDLHWWNDTLERPSVNLDYNQISNHVIKEFGVVILLAGHSSVKMCLNDMFGAFNNNVNNFVSLLNKLDNNQKFIYASSSSVYNGKRDATEESQLCFPTNWYDLTKMQIDQYAILSDKKIYGLRLGTVNGFSSNLRIDLMINKMVYDFFEIEDVWMSNGFNHRPILGMNDLCRAIDRIISKDAPRGIYNLASFNSYIKDISRDVCRELGTYPRESIGEATYDFSINCNKFEASMDFKFYDNVYSIVNELIPALEPNSKILSTKKGRPHHDYIL